MTPPNSLRRLAAAAVLTLAATPAFAQAPAEAQLKAAREVVNDSGVANSMNDIVPIFLDEAKRTFLRTDPALSKDLDDCIKILTPEFQKRRDELMNQIAAIYADKFSADELAQIRTFYQSPVGAKLVKEMPSILQASYDRTNAWSQQMSQDVISRLRAEMKKKGHDI
ncbi:MAG TPA: DUF2059 domain-containing protein [Hansschlegelia sp.]